MFVFFLSIFLFTYNKNHLSKKICLPSAIAVVICFLIVPIVSTTTPPWSSCDCLVVLLSRFAFPVAHVSSFDLPFKSVPSSLLVYIYTHSYVPDTHVTFKINYVMGFMATTHLLQISYNSMFFN